MNIVKQELKQGLKTFLFWTLGIGFLIIGGMVKFVGFTGADSGTMTGMLAAFPKPVLAIFGMAEANIETFGGFYSVLQFYVMIAVCCYAIYLGTSGVLRESIDKTYEFLFTKPCGRLYILSMKLLSGLCWLTLICILNGVFSYLAPSIYGIENSISDRMMLFIITLYLVALLFYALSAMLSVLRIKSERAIQLSYGVLLLCYGVSVLFDMDARFESLRFLTPFKYFRASELLNGDLSVLYVIAVLIMAVAFTGITYYWFKRKDLNAV